jgi:hypothetical protein
VGGEGVGRKKTPRKGNPPVNLHFQFTLTTGNIPSSSWRATGTCCHLFLVRHRQNLGIWFNDPSSRLRDGPDKLTCHNSQGVAQREREVGVFHTEQWDADWNVWQRGTLNSTKTETHITSCQIKWSSHLLRTQQAIVCELKHMHTRTHTFIWNDCQWWSSKTGYAGYCWYAHKVYGMTCCSRRAPGNVQQCQFSCNGKLIGRLSRVHRCLCWANRTLGNSTRTQRVSIT